MLIPRAVESAPELNGHTPNNLVLDGQQRLSSLYQAFYGKGSHRFFVDVAALMKGDDLDAAITYLPASRAKSVGSIEAQADQLIFPLSSLDTFSSWRDDVVDHRSDLSPDGEKRLRKFLNRIGDAIIQPISSYQFPVTTLSEATSAEAVCTIFETLNRTGVRLSVFELICARAFAKGHRLREMWNEAQQLHPVLADFDIDPYYVLQAIALRLGKKPQRGFVIGLSVESIVEDWNAAIRGMERALIMLRDECGVLTLKLLPYSTMLPTLAAAWRDVDDATGAAAGARRLKLQRWFWCACFRGEYENAPNSRAEADVPTLQRWLVDQEEPATVRDFQFDPATWASTTIRQRGLYRSTMALLMRRHPLDFHQVVPLTKAVIDGSAVDDHHVFPTAYLASTENAGRTRCSITPSSTSSPT